MQRCIYGIFKTKNVFDCNHAHRLLLKLLFEIYRTLSFLEINVSCNMTGYIHIRDICQQKRSEITTYGMILRLAGH
jgi:hypothetical protein